MGTHMKESYSGLHGEMVTISKSEFDRMNNEIARLKACLTDVTRFYGDKLTSQMAERIAAITSGVQSSVQSPDKYCKSISPRCVKCGSFDLVPSSTGGTACWKCHAEQPTQRLKSPSLVNDELLQALKGLIEPVEYCYRFGRVKSFDELLHAITSAKAAIAKASKKGL
jgi:hypothetical protein